MSPRTSPTQTMFDLDVLAAAVRRAVAHGLTAEQIDDAVTYARRHPNSSSTSRVGAPRLPELSPTACSSPMYAPDVAVLVVRDPDGPCDVTVYHQHQRIDAAVYQVDAGAGSTAADWEASRVAAVADVSGHLQADLDSAYGDPPGDEYIAGFNGGDRR